MLLYIKTGFCCAFPRHAKTPLGKPNEATVEQQIALRSLIGDREARNGRASGSGGAATWIRPRKSLLHRSSIGRAADS